MCHEILLRVSMSGQESHRATIFSISNSKPCTIVTNEENGYSTGNFVRLTNLNGSIPVEHGADPLNNNRYKIVVTDTDTFYLKDPITGKDIDSTNYTPYVEGGLCNKIENIFIYEGS